MFTLARIKDIWSCNNLSTILHYVLERAGPWRHNLGPRREKSTVRSASM